MMQRMRRMVRKRPTKQDEHQKNSTCDGYKAFNVGQERLICDICLLWEVRTVSIDE